MNHQIDRLIKLWIALLTITAGFLNATAFLNFARVITHHSGTVMAAGVTLVAGDWQALWQSVSIIISFMMGAMISGSLFPHEVFKPKKRYGGILLTLGSILLVLLMIKVPLLLILCFLSFISGAQNGMFVTYRGIIVRTTHLTGTLTDFGVSLGRWVRTRNEHQLFKLTFHFLNSLAFFVGCVLSALIEKFTTWNGLIICAYLYIIIGLIYYLLQKMF